jgi:hypothetical protein
MNSLAGTRPGLRRPARCNDPGRSATRRRTASASAGRRPGHCARTAGAADRRPRSPRTGGQPVCRRSADHRSVRTGQYHGRSGSLAHDSAGCGAQGPPKARRAVVSSAWLRPSPARPRASRRRKGMPARRGNHGPRETLTGDAIVLRGRGWRRRTAYGSCRGSIVTVTVGISRCPARGSDGADPGPGRCRVPGSAPRDLWRIARSCCNSV